MSRASEISASAADWLIRLESQVSPELWEAFQEWLDSDARHRAAFIRLRQAWTRCDRFKALRPADGTIDADLLLKLDLDLHDTETEPPDRPRMTTRRWLAAAAAAAVLAVASFAWLSAGSDGWKEYETDVGGRENVVLSDGSSIQLNTDSRMRVRMSVARRDIELVRGEALFTVAHDRLRPFYVKAAGTFVRAVGTAFSVRIRDDQHVEVLVSEGRVALGGPVLATSTPVLAARESAVIGPQSLEVKRLPPASIPRRLAWTSGRIAFDGETLTEAVSEFNRYNKRHLAISDPAITGVRVGGIFEATDPESFVAALEKSFSIRRAVPAEAGSEWHDQRAGEVIGLVGK